MVDRSHRRIERPRLIQQVCEILELLHRRLCALAPRFLFALLLVERPLVGPLAFARRHGERLRVCHDLLRAGQMAGVCARFYLPADAHPVLLEGVVPLDDGLQPEPLAGVADLLPPQSPDPALDILARNHGFDLLDAEEVLLVERAQTLDSRLQLLDFLV